MMHPDEYYTMAAAERNHWWYRSLHQLVLRAVQRFFSSKTISIVDAACGTGGLMSFLLEKGYKNIRGFDLNETAVKLCKEKGLNVMQGDIKNIATYYDTNSADVVVCNDALYFLNEYEQKQFLKDTGTILKSNGVLIMNVPALQAFSGMHDIRVGISRRFTPPLVNKLFSTSYYSLTIQLYWPFALSPFIWLARLRQRRQMKDNSATEVASDVKVGNSFVNTILYFITNTENKLLKRKPFGSSLFLVAQKQQAQI